MVALVKPDNQITIQQKTALKGPHEGTNLPPPNNRIAASIPQKSNEWYTPARYIEAAREVMNGIDLDPASCELANQTVRASRYYSKEDDGLSKEWIAKSVWCNPPYGLDKSLPNEQRSTVGKWTRKLIHHFQIGDISQAILLSTAQVNASWFSLLWQYPICFPDDKIRFYLPHGSASKSREGRNFDSHIFGSVLVYLGTNEHKFIETFSQFGTIAKRVSPPKSAPSTLWEVTL